MATLDNILAEVDETNYDNVEWAPKAFSCKSSYEIIRACKKLEKYLERLREINPDMEQYVYPKEFLRLKGDRLVREIWGMVYDYTEYIKRITPDLIPATIGNEKGFRAICSTMFMQSIGDETYPNKALYRAIQAIILWIECDMTPGREYHGNVSYEKMLEKKEMRDVIIKFIADGVIMTLIEGRSEQDAIPIIMAYLKHHDIDRRRIMSMAKKIYQYNQLQ